MRKSMNTMNAMERLNAATNNVDNAAMNRILDGSINLDGLHAMKNIDMNKCETPIQVMQKIYNAESLVGAVTTVVGNICNVDVTIPEGFAEFKESLLQLKDKSVHVPYGDSIWVDGVNVLRGYHFVTGHFYCYYVVTNAEMKAIETKVKDMSKKQMTVADAQALQSDLGPILRAWQESSIDCTKDKDKKFNYDFRNFFKKIDVISTFCKKHADKIELNRINDFINRLTAKVNQLSFNKETYNNLVTEHNALKLLFEDADVIKDSLNASKGIPLIFLQVYLKNCPIMMNNLLDTIYNGDLQIEGFMIDENEFRIPFVKSGIKVPDISFASQGESSFISIVLSLSLIIQSMTKYDIICLDELDGPLDTKNREQFIKVLYSFINQVKSDQVFLISHNNMFDNEPIDLILTGDVDVENYKFANVIFKP